MLIPTVFAVSENLFEPIIPNAPNMLFVLEPSMPPKKHLLPVLCVFSNSASSLAASIVWVPKSKVVFALPVKKESFSPILRKFCVVLSIVF